MASSPSSAPVVPVSVDGEETKSVDASMPQSLRAAVASLTDVVARLSETSSEKFSAARQASAEALADLQASCEGLRARGETALEDLPNQPIVERVKAALEQALEALNGVHTAATENASSLSASLTTSLATARESLRSAAAQVHSLASTTAARVSAIAASAAQVPIATLHESGAAAAMSSAYASLRDVVAWLSETSSEKLAAARKASAEALARLEFSAEGFRARGQRTFADLLAALNASASAVAMAGKATETAVSTSLTASLATARKSIGTAVTHVNSLATSTAGHVTARAATAAHSAAMLGVRTAASLDSRFGVQDRVVGVSKAVNDRLKVHQLAERLRLRHRVSSLLSRVSSLDTSLTAGRGQSATAATWGYLTNLADEYNSTRSELSAPAAAVDTTAAAVPVATH